MKIIKLFVLCFFAFNCLAMDENRLKSQLHTRYVQLPPNILLDKINRVLHTKEGTIFLPDPPNFQSSPERENSGQNRSLRDIPVFGYDKASKVSDEERARILEDLKHLKIVRSLIEEVD